MKVGLAVYGNLANRSGGYLYDAKLVEGLEDKGHEVDLISLKRRGYQEELLAPPSELIQRWVSGHHLDVLLEDELAHPSLLGANSKLKGSIPLVSIVHNLGCEVALDEAERQRLRAQERRFLNGVDACVFNSRSTRDAAERITGKLMRGQVALPGKDHVDIPRRAGRDFDARRLDILFVSNLLPYKGLDTLVSALAKLGREDFKLRVVGRACDQVYVDSVRRQVDSEGMLDEVEFLGRVDDARLSSLLDESHLLAVPSLHEGLGIVYMEAMGHGLPVMASASGGAKEIIRDGVQGFLIPPRGTDLLAERLTRVHDDRSLLRRMSNEARSRYDSLPTWKESMEPAVSFIEELVRKAL
ncbi:MAG TPA: glycosyltransferase family 4 protein [Methanomassiliicoccales archaeon]|nr:glycosyltransferase family 4 protein [Methanomassiliicoccales archaeon]